MKNPHIGYLLLLSGLLITGSGIAGSLRQEWTRWPDVRDLFAAASARDQLQADYRRLRDDGRLSRTEDAEYAAYLGNLDLRIASQCSQVMTRHPQLDPQLLPCPAKSPAGSTAAAGGGAATAAARQSLERMEAELARELGSFDDMLLREQQTISERAPRAPSAAANTGDARGQGGQRSAGGQRQETGGPFTAEAEAVKPRQGSASSTASPAYGTPGKGGNSHRPPPDIPRGSRDDVVARQLREAAERESDPELKRKLWAEYRRYTASSL